MEENNLGNINEEINEKVKKPKKKKSKFFLVGVGIVLVSFISGLVGGGITYYCLGKKTAVNQSTSVDFKNTSAMTIQEVYKKVAPAVVIVSTKSVSLTNGIVPQEVEGIGSGFIINEDGEILTNYHVVKGAKDVKVTLSTGQEVDAEVVNYDEAQDVALLKLKEKVKIPAVAELGDSNSLQPGQTVVAIGTPLSKEFASTITEGIVSAVGRSVDTKTGTQINLIQTDAAINPGNSGGPLVNAEGQVVGINTMKVSGEAEGLGFAIPINEVRDRLAFLSKPAITLGIRIVTIDAEKAKQNNLPEGIYVAEVDDFSIAQKGGIKPGDVIVSFDGKKVKSAEELNKIKETLNAGQKVPMVVQRDGKTVDLTLTV
ncbi:trypsin-like peptidase domain-containing protein [uncultured Clostridium sp.]|uniref:S1C family serine protease n=1 Tax=uncultured Clostridium sp. TaxID=59620 RepID=UPI0026173782|nr:trypsin-like peptidase domain-containing protein [uncultured Clostridium sp.]